MGKALNAADLSSARLAVRSCFAALKPPPKLSLSEWADEHYYLSAESAAETGRWKTLPYQKGIMDEITNPLVEKVSVKKSARVGYTKCMNAAIGYYMDQDPSSMLVVQPTVDDAKGYSKEEIAPMIRDCPRLAAKVLDDPDVESGPKDSSNTILHKKFPGGVLSMVGANSGGGFRRISRRVVLFDEVDAYPPSAGSDGDPIKLGTARTQFFWNRKIIAGSTPLIAGRSRIEELFLDGDQRRYYVPCPGCGHMDHLVFRQKEGGGHHMQFDPLNPESAHFVCSANGCVIEHKDKREMVTRGEWRGAKPFTGHASFHIWAAYSFSPNATWTDIAREFISAKSNVEKLKTFINTWLGETWQEQGDAPDWERLYSRREEYALGSVPDRVLFLTSGVDVQKDRFVWEVVGWGYGKESWSIDAGIIFGDTSNEETWLKLDELLNRTFLPSDQRIMTISAMAVDAGFNTQMVYNWGRRHPMSRVMAVKGTHTARTLLGVPSPVDVTIRGKRFARGYRVWAVGVSIAKAELYGWLRLPRPTDGAPFPAGYCHFPEHGEEFFKQLTSEQLVTVVNQRTHFAIHEWQVLPDRENHWLDARVYARAAAAMLQIDRMRPPVDPTSPPAPASATTQSDEIARRPGRFLQSGNLNSGRGKGWLR